MKSILGRFARYQSLKILVIDTFWKENWQQNRPENKRHKRSFPKKQENHDSRTPFFWLSFFGGIIWTPLQTDSNKEIKSVCTHPPRLRNMQLCKEKLKTKCFPNTTALLQGTWCIEVFQFTHELVSIAGRMDEHDKQFIALVWRWT